MKAKKRIIYSDFEMLGNEFYESVKKWLLETNENVTEEEIEKEVQNQSEEEWANVTRELKDFFSGKTWLLQGMIGTWNGNVRGGFIFHDFTGFCKALEKCDYIDLYDQNGHLFLECSHHDGTNHYEIKQVSKTGDDYLHRWESGYTCKSEEEIHNNIMKYYSVLPHFCYKTYGCPKREYEKTS